MSTSDSWKSLGRWTIALTGALLLGILPGCVGEQTDSATMIEPADAPSVPLPPKSVVLGEFIAHVRPSRRSITFEAATPAAGKGVSPQSIDDLNVTQDGVAGSGPANTIELVTNTVGYNAQCPAGYQTASFCGNVTLRHFFSGSLANVFVQVLSVYSPTTGLEMTGHGGINGDGSEFGLDATKGLWKYTAPAATTPGIVGASPNNSGTRDWVFANPDDADTYIRMRVISSLTYASYVFDFSSQAFVDACATGTNVGAVSQSTQTMPFPFTLYGNTDTTVKFNKRGMITFGAVAGTASGVSLALPSASAPKPALFVFWDDIGFAATSTGMCYVTIGTAPNRKYVIEWNNMNFVPVADQTASLTFEAVLSEGTNNIDVVYKTMTGPTTRVSGNLATVGVQNATGTVATSEFHLPDFGSANAYTFVAQP